MEIPTSFELGAITYNVIFDNEKCNEEGNYGTSSYSTSTITLSTTYGVKPLSEGKIEHTYYHELVHMILDTIHERKLSSNEKFVDNFASYLHQYLKTVKYEPHNSK